MKRRVGSANALWGNDVQAAAPRPIDTLPRITYCFVNPSGKDSPFPLPYPAMAVPVTLYTLGQTPRPDLVPPILATLNSPDVDIVGVLDGLEPGDIRPPEPGNYPLKTRLSDGTEVATDCAFLQPRLQKLIDGCEDRTLLHLVLSVAPFQSLHAEGMLIRPFEHGCRALAQRHIHEICVVVPHREQIFHARQKWAAAGFSAHIRCMQDRPENTAVEDWVGGCLKLHPADGVVIDFVGYSKTLTQKLESTLQIPVMDLGFEAAGFARSILDEFNQIEKGMANPSSHGAHLTASLRAARMLAN